MNLLLKSSSVDKYDLSGIKEVLCGGASLSKDSENSLKAKFKIEIIRQGYGLTETISAVVLPPLNESKFGSTGKILPCHLIKIVDLESYEAIEPHKLGEIYIKGEMVMKCYAGDKKATKMAFTEDGWLITGDVGYYDDDGFIYLVDRKKELIKYKAFQVAPAELELVLLMHPDIKEAGVIGVPNEDAGELPMAFVVTQPGKNLSETEVCDFVAREVSPEKRLRGGVKFIKEIPRNKTGKILRKALRQMVST